jgi:replicative DNA helicase
MPDGMTFGGEQQLLGPAQRMPPNNLQVEQALLGALLANNKAADICGSLRPHHFYDPVNGKIFNRIMQRINAGQIADLLSINADFQNTCQLEEVGGTAYLASLMKAMVAINVAGDYAKITRDAWLCRELIEAGERIADEAYGTDPSDDAQAKADRALEAVLALGETSADTQGVDFAQAAKSAFARSQAAYRGDAGHARLDTGIPGVDKLWGGLWPGQLYYLMARSRTGKTPAMLQIARNVAKTLLAESEAIKRPPGHVHIFSLEMTADDLLTVNLASTSRWTSDQIQAGDIGGAADWLELERAQATLGRLPIIVEDSAEMDITALMMRARSVKRKRDTRLICVDYRELIRRGREQARMGLPEWIPYLGYQLKALAKATNCPVIALAQINKARDGQDSTRPTLTDLPYDGGQAADAVFALHRPELYMGDGPPTSQHSLSKEKQADKDAAWHADRAKAAGVAEFIALKRRFGPTGIKSLRFNGPRMLLSDPDHGYAGHAGDGDVR